MQKIIDKLFDLYLIQHYHYLLQLKDGSYVTRNSRRYPLRIHHLTSHLSGKKPIGTFAGSYLTKFICFDVDFTDPAMAKWVTYRLADALNSFGLSDYLISFSGSKGYHVELFFDSAISNDSARRFYELTLAKADLYGITGGQVEFRPTSTQGVKIPLSQHQKTGLFCGFCTVDSGLTVMDREQSYAYLLASKKTSAAILLELISDENSYDNKAASDMENVVVSHKPLEIYDQSESYTLSRAADRYYTGLTAPGQRHKSFLLLARLMNHNGVERPEAFDLLAEWFSWQDYRFYTSDREFCMQDLRECVDFVYDNDKTLLVEQRELIVSFAEIDAIIRRCPLKSQKALVYALLMHSKRFAGENGVFYMTFKQMAEAVGVDERTARRQINQLETLSVVEIISRNQRQKGTHIKKPNFYRMKLVDTEAADDRIYTISDETDLHSSIRYFYTEKEIRTLLPRRQSDAVLA